MALDVEALSAVRVAQRRWQRDGDVFLTLIVKATFAYATGRDAWLVEPEPLSLEIAEDAVPDPLLRRAARAARATELAPNLRRGGLSVLGFACAPPGTMARSIDLRLALYRGDEALFDKRLHVLGDRQSADAFPDPFEAIPLVDELCFGGPSVPENPRGVGAGPDPSALPNILPFDRSARYASFAPLPTPRTSSLFASIDEVETTIRSDADWEAYQTAPPDQRIMGMREFFLGDERLVMEGMDRSAPSVEARLPRVRALARWVRPGRGARSLELRGDCVVVDTEARRLHVTWRGQIPAPADPAETVRAAVALAFGDATEAEAAAWPEDLATLGVSGKNAAALAALASAARALPATARGRTLDIGHTPDLSGGSETLTAGLVFDPSAGAPSWVARTPPRTDDAARAAAPIPGAPWSPIEANKVDAAVWGEETFEPAEADLARAAPALAAVAPVAPPALLGRAPDWVPKADVPLTIGALHVAAQRAQQAAAREAATPNDVLALDAAPAKPVEMTRAPERPERLAPVEKGAAARPPRPAKESPERADCLARIEKGQSLEGMALAGVDLSGIDFRERALARAVLTGARLEGAILARCNLTGANLEDADLTEADLSSAILTRADLSRATLTGAVLDRAQLVDATLEAVKAERASFKGVTGMRPLFAHADLTDAVFGGASLDRADFTGATLARADLTGATLLRGRFDEAKAEGVVLNGARVNDSRWEDANAEGLAGRGLSAQHSVWTNARLGGAALEKADLRGAQMRKASLARAVLTDADLRDVDLREADLSGANLSRANLEAAIVARAGAEGVRLDGARLSGADVRDAVLANASLNEASCVRARLDGAQLSRAELTRADLRHATLRDAKLGRANLSQALVDGADLRGADLDGATLYKVDLARARAATPKTK